MTRSPGPVRRLFPVSFEIPLISRLRSVLMFLRVQSPRVRRVEEFALFAWATDRPGRVPLASSRRPASRNAREEDDVASRYAASRCVSLGGRTRPRVDTSDCDVPFASRSTQQCTSHCTDKLSGSPVQFAFATIGRPLALGPHREQWQSRRLLWRTRFRTPAITCSAKGHEYALARVTRADSACVRESIGTGRSAVDRRAAWHDLMARLTFEEGDGQPVA